MTINISRRFALTTLTEELPELSDNAKKRFRWFPSIAGLHMLTNDSVVELLAALADSKESSCFREYDRFNIIGEIESTDLEEEKEFEVNSCSLDIPEKDPTVSLYEVAKELNQELCEVRLENIKLKNENKNLKNFKAEVDNLILDIGKKDFPGRLI